MTPDVAWVEPGSRSADSGSGIATVIGTPECEYHRPVSPAGGVDRREGASGMRASTKGRVRRVCGHAHSQFARADRTEIRHEAGHRLASTASPGDARHRSHSCTGSQHDNPIVALSVCHRTASAGQRVTTVTEPDQWRVGNCHRERLGDHRRTSHGGSGRPLAPSRRTVVGSGTRRRIPSSATSPLAARATTPTTPPTTPPAVEGTVVVRGQAVAAVPVQAQPTVTG